MQVELVEGLARDEFHPGATIPTANNLLGRRWQFPDWQPADSMNVIEHHRDDESVIGQCAQAEVDVIGATRSTEVGVRDFVEPERADIAELEAAQELRIIAPAPHHIIAGIGCGQP